MSIERLWGRAGNVVNGVRRGIRLMTPAERTKAVILAFTSLIDGLLQTAAIVALVPILQLMLNPQTRLPGGLLRRLELPLFETDRSGLMLDVAAGLVLLIFVKSVFNWLQLGWMARFSAGCEFRLSSFLLDRTLHAPYAWLVRQNSERLRQLIFGFVATWSRDFVRSLMKLVNDFAFAAFVVGTLVWASPLSGLAIALVVATLSLITFLVVRPRLMSIATAKRSTVVAANSITSEAILGVKEVKMAGAEKRFVALFDKQLDIYTGSDARAQQIAQMPRIVIEGIAYIGLIAISAAVVIYNANTEASGLLLLYGLAMIRLLPVFSTVVSGLTVLVGAFPILIDLEHLIASTATAETPAPEGVVPIPWQEIRLARVSYHYTDADRAALNNVSLMIKPGRSYGVVGRSGAGKSTLIDLIAGLLQPTDGEILVDGKPLGPEQHAIWRRRFGYVVQRPFLLDASLRDNIAFNAKGPVDMARLQNVISTARLENVVARLRGGVDGRVGEQGALLSGGERQRVAIARALYRGADLLILDEATSSLDPLVEREIAESLASLHGKVTTIIVSHRLGLVRGCDDIWLFDEAGLSARGTHQELLQASGLYRQMVTQPDSGLGRDDVFIDGARPMSAAEPKASA